MQDNLTATIITPVDIIITLVICSAIKYAKPFLMRLR